MSFPISSRVAAAEATNTVYGLRVEPVNAVYLNTHSRIMLKNDRNYIRIEPIIHLDNPDCGT